MFSDAESPLGRAGSEGICSRGGGGEPVELSTWCRAISVLCSEMTSWVSQGVWRSPFHHATQGTEPSSLVSDPPKPKVGVEVALRNSLRPRLSLGTSKGSITSQDVPHGKPHSVLGPSSGQLLPTTGRWPWSWGGGGVGLRLTTVGRNLCTLPPASAGPRPALVAYHPLLLQGIQDRSTLPPYQRDSKAPQPLRVFV